MGIQDLSFREINKGATASTKKDALNSSVASFSSPIKSQLNGTLKSLFNSFGIRTPESLCRRYVAVLFIDAYHTLLQFNLQNSFTIQILQCLITETILFRSLIITKNVEKYHSII